ncbi:MAG: hypothetical protein HY343_07530 [Lentisphaerae bacterium]|nr:hypothetical protein [Lentisphaerota bacterium]
MISWETIQALAAAAIEKIFAPLLAWLDKATLDKTAAAKMQADLQTLKARATSDYALALLNLQLNWQQLTASARWREVLIYAVWSVILLIELNNLILAPYIPSVKTLAVPLELWIVAGGLIGIDILPALSNLKSSNLKSKGSA